jgi:hypothetical protein
VSRVDDLRAELELAELEAALVAAKAEGSDDLAEIKLQVRAARQAYREAREG